MLKPQYILPLAGELVVDLFAGGGGASCGIEQAIGRHVDIAVNHDPEAVSLHQANHPQTEHHVSNVWEVDPRVVCAGRPIGLLWASPDCTFHNLMKLCSVSGVMMANADGADDAFDRLLGTAQFVLKTMPKQPAKLVKVH